MPLHKQPHAEPPPSLPPSLTHAFPHEMEREEEEAPSRSSHNVMNMLLHPPKHTEASHTQHSQLQEQKRGTGSGSFSRRDEWDEEIKIPDKTQLESRKYFMCLYPKYPPHPLQNDLCWCCPVMQSCEPWLIPLSAALTAGHERFRVLLSISFVVTAHLTHDTTHCSAW